MITRKSTAFLAMLACLLLTTSCAYVGQFGTRIPVEFIPAPSKPSPKDARLVIVLPGIGDRAEVVKQTGIVDAIQQNMPDADVMVVELAFTYYMQGMGAQQLHDRVIRPALQRGYRDVYLVGASLGGMGALLYERQYPNQLSGLILMAPFMGVGGNAMVKEISDAGGILHWNPGPRPERMSFEQTSREQWRVVQSWKLHPERARNVWLICGENDRFHPVAEMIAPLVPSSNFVTIPGGHTWTVWNQGAAEAFAALSADAG